MFSKFIFSASVLAMASVAAAAPFTEVWFRAATDPTVDTTFAVANSGNTERSAAYNPATGNVLVVSRFSTPSIRILNGTTGAHIGTMDANTGTITGGDFTMNGIAVDATGVIYVANLSVAGGNFKVYRWANEAAAPTVAFAGAVSGGSRVGDVFALRGTGTSTVLYTSGTGNSRIEVFTTADGSTFTEGTDIDLTALTPALTAGAARTGIAPLANGNLIVTGVGTPVHEINPTAGTSASHDNSIIGGSFGGLGVYQSTTSTPVLLLAGQSGNTGSQFGRVWNINGGVTAPVTVESTPAQGSTTNTNGTGAAFFFEQAGQLRLGVLSTNNGIGVYGNIFEFTDVQDWAMY